MTKKKTATKQLRSPDSKLPFLEHFKELKRRLTIVAVSIGVFSVGAYFVQHQIVELLLTPAKGQELIYTSPAGGMNFLIQVCLYTGVILSLPVIIYQMLKYFEPLMGRKSARFALFGSFTSAVLALAGMAFGYFAGLPAVLHFLFNQFSPTSEIQPLIAVTSYMGFVTLYMFGATLLFQVPLVLIFINRIKRLKTSTLIKGERWFILFAFILAFIMNPTPNVIEQVMLAGPMIVMYQVGIGLVWLLNRKPEPATALAVELAAVQDEIVRVKEPKSARLLLQKRSARISTLRAQDLAIQAERAAKLADAKLIWLEASVIADTPLQSMVAMTDHAMPKIVDATLQPAVQPVQVKVHVPSPTPIRPVQVRAGMQRRYVDGIPPVRHPGNRSHRA